MKKLKIFFKKIDFNGETPISIYKKLSQKNGFILQSAKPKEESGRYSFIGGNPFIEFKSKGKEYWINGKKGKGKPFDKLKKLVKSFSVKKSKNLPPFYGGAVGVFSYEFLHNFEKLPNRAKDDLKLPDSYFIFADKVFAFDNLEKKLYLIALSGEKSDGMKKIAEMKKVLWKKIPKNAGFTCEKKLKSNFSKQKYIQAILKIKEYIKAGDTFQVNLSQRFETEIDCNAIDLFEKLMDYNPGNFCALLDFEEFKVISSSPERLLKVENGYCETKPIAGTRKRGKNILEDLFLENELLSSEKENAEHTMLVDLARNDLGKVCNYGTVKVSKQMAVEKYSKVMHLVSTVKGKLHSEKDCFDAFKALFPGGTITGCPKIRTMEIIDELEPCQRSFYTGSIGYFNFSGDCDFNIVIRTIVLKGKKAFIQLGGGIVFDSIPEKEFEETLSKGEALFNAIQTI